MPRSPVITDFEPEQSIQRRLAEAEEAQRNRTRVSSGAPGAPGAPGAEGPEGHGAGVLYRYITNTENSDPGTGNLKFGGPLGENTVMRISETDADGNLVGPWLKTWDDNGGIPNGYMFMRKRGAPGTFIILKLGRVTTTITDNGTWLFMTEFEKVGGSAEGFANNDYVFVEYYPVGQKGETGATGSKGSPGEPGGFKYIWAGKQEKSTSSAFAANNVAPPSMTKFYVGASSMTGQNIKSWLESFDDSGGESDRGFVIVRDLVEAKYYAVLRVTGKVTSEAEGVSFSVEYIAGSTELSNPLALHEHSLEFYRSGKEGPKGETGSAGTNGAEGKEGKEGKEGPPGAATMADFKESCRAATTANITISTALNNGDSLDGVTLATGDRVLVKNQTTKKENGIWVVGVTPTRSTDADGAGELSGGTMVYVEQGTINKKRFFKIITAGSITPGTTEHEWESLEPKDFGIVEALPTTEAMKGDVCRFKASTGIYWEMLYTEEVTYPWAKVGGPPLFAQYTAAETLTTESETPQTTNAPKITLPAVKMEADFTWGAHTSVTTGAGAQARLDLYINEAAASGANGFSASGGSGAAEIGPLRGERRTTAEASKVIEARYHRAGGTKATFYSPYLKVDPLRLG